MQVGYLFDTEKQSAMPELGPIRPPSEAYSLLIRATRNCPWNRCLFCRLYKGSRFELRSVEEILRDIESARAISKSLREMAWRMGYGNEPQEVAATFYNQPQCAPAVRNIALWLWAGARSAFLQDSNTLIMRTSELVQVISSLRKTFPTIDRVTCYSRSHTSARKSLEELREIRNAGLARIHTGLETGCDPLLAFMQKGATAEQHIKGGRKIVEAGISLCEYVMPGLGGRSFSQQHASQTAKVLNEINPEYIRLRSLHVTRSMPLWSRLQDGDFELQTDDEVVEEIGALIENLELTSYLKSDHVLNLLMEVEGKLPEDKQNCLNVINEYLGLPEEERLNFKLGRRMGYYERLADLGDGYKHRRVDELIGRIRSEGKSVDEVILRLKDNFI